MRGLTLLDLLVTLGLLALLIYLARLDWRREAPAPADHSATHSSFTSV
jgi:hypothetical protein